MTSFEPRFYSESDCHRIFHNFKIKYLENYKKYLPMATGVCPPFVGSFVSDQFAFWVDFPFNHCLSEFLLSVDLQSHPSSTRIYNSNCLSIFVKCARQGLKVVVLCPFRQISAICIICMKKYYSSRGLIFGKSKY